MLSRNELMIALTIGIGIALLGLLEKTMDSYNNVFNLVTMIESPTQSSMTGNDLGAVTAMFVILLPLLVSFPCAWFYHKEMDMNLVPSLISRGKYRNYYISKAIVICTTGFVLTVIPLIINLLFHLVAYPFSAHGIFSESAYKGFGTISQAMVMNNVTFPLLYINKPVINALVHILLIGIFGAGMGILTYAITLYFRKNIVITLATTTVLGLLLLIINSYTMTATIWPQAIVYTSPLSSMKISVFITEMIILFGLCIFMLVYKISKQRDVL